MNNRLVIVALIFCVLTSTVNAQKRNAKKKTETKQATGNYLIDSFDASLSELPRGFQGHNAIEIYNRMAIRQAMKKGEFETTDAFKQRATVESVQPIVGTLTQDSVFAFVINDVKSQYDADNQMLEVMLALENVRDGYSLRDESKEVQWKLIKESASKYVASNAFGKKVVVHRLVASRYNISFDNYTRFPLIAQIPDYLKSYNEASKRMYKEAGIPYNGINENRKNKFFGVSLNVDIPTAKRLKTSLRVLLICKLTLPYVIKGISSLSPTINLPIDGTTTEHNLHTALLELWFFDYETGQVYTKQKAKY